MTDYRLQLIPDPDGRFLRENFRRIEEWVKNLLLRIDLIDGGGP